MATIKELLEGASAFFTKKPERASTTTSVTCSLVGVTEVEVSTGRHVVTADEPKFAGGTDAGPSPANYVLVALGACEAVTYRYWSERLEIPFDSLRVEVEGDVDLRGALGFEGVRPGHDAIRVTIHVSGSESTERYEELRRVVDATCPVSDSLARPVAVSSVLEVTPTAGRAPA